MRNDLDATSRQMCFPSPMPAPSLVAQREFVRRLDISSSVLAPTQVLAGLSDAAAVALANVLPCFLCGEESAVQVFANEGNRISSTFQHGASTTLFRIAAEEEYHEELLAHLQAGLPAAQDLGRRRQMARRYFQRIASRDVGDHFSRIAALDSAVCIILAEMMRPGGAFLRDSVAAGIFSRIRHDEGRHVRFSRHYAAALGVTRDSAAESFELVRSGLIELLKCAGAGFESLAVDPDRLFRRLGGSVPKGV
jgi:hypothetical protein